MFKVCDYSLEYKLQASYHNTKIWGSEIGSADAVHFRVVTLTPKFTLVAHFVSITQANQSTLYSSSLLEHQDWSYILYIKLRRALQWAIEDLTATSCTIQIDMWNNSKVVMIIERSLSRKMEGLPQCLWCWNKTACTPTETCSLAAKNWIYLEACIHFQLIFEWGTI